jgi:hypothetical protein
MKYTITNEDEDLVEDFIQRAYQYHIRSKRSEDEVKEDIRIGKLGEIAYKAYVGNDANEIDWSGIPQGTGEDFVHLERGKIQVKTLREDSKWCTFYNWNFDELVVFRIVRDQVLLIGEFSKENLKNDARKSNWSGWYIDPENC